MENANTIKFRCSSLGYIMTESRSKSETLSETCKTHLIDVFVSAKYGRREEITGKFLDKGNEREEDSITLLSRATKIFYKKNEERIENDFISGTPDLYLGIGLQLADETNDTKTSWSAHTFFRAQKEALNKMYYWQGQGYMDLTGAKKHTVTYCLVNGTAKAIMDEKRRLAYAMGVLDTQATDNVAYLEKCKQIEVNHIFDMEAFKNENPFFEFDNDLEKWTFDIPISERIFQFTFDRNDADIERMHQRVIECRNFMNENLFKI